MKKSDLRRKIRSIIQEFETDLHVVKAKKVGLEHKEGFTITLSDGREDYAPLANFILKSYTSAMYGCKLIKGIMRGKLDGGRYLYEFDGIDCKEYVKAYPESIKLAGQIS